MDIKEFWANVWEAVNAVKVTGSATQEEAIKYNLIAGNDRPADYIAANLISTANQKAKQTIKAGDYVNEAKAHYKRVMEDAEAAFYARIKALIDNSELVQCGLAEIAELDQTRAAALEQIKSTDKDAYRQKLAADYYTGHRKGELARELKAAVLESVTSDREVAEHWHTWQRARNMIDALNYTQTHRSPWRAIG